MNSDDNCMKNEKINGSELILKNEYQKQEIHGVKIQNKFFSKQNEGENNFEKIKKTLNQKYFSFYLLTICFEIFDDKRLEKMMKFEKLQNLFNEFCNFFFDEININIISLCIFGISLILFLLVLLKYFFTNLKKKNFLKKKEKSFKKIINSEKNSLINLKSQKISIETADNSLKQKKSLNKINRYKKNMRKLSEDFFSKFQKTLPEKKTSKNSPIFFENKKFQNCFKNRKIIGKGGFGEIYKAKHILENKIYCIKKIPFINEEKNIKNSEILKEVKTMVALQSHNNIVEYCTSWIEKIEIKKIELKKFKTNYLGFENDLNDAIDSGENSFEICFEEESCENDYISKRKDQISNKSEDLNQKCGERYNLFIQMEYCDSFSLDKYLLNSKIELEEKHCFFLFSQILNGLKFIHQKGYIHYDLKPGNIFLHQNEIKIGDFGLSSFLEKQENDKIIENTKSDSFKNKENLNKNKKSKKNQKKNENSKKKTNRVFGTPLYSAPEQENEIFTQTQKSDVYSLGIILFILVSKFKTYHEKIKSLEFIKLNNKVTQEFKNDFPIVSKLVNILLEKDLDKRPESFEIEMLDEFILWEDKISKMVSC